MRKDNDSNITQIHWSRAISIEELSKIFNVHRNTMSKWLREQVIRNRKLTARKWQVSIDEFPGVFKKRSLPILSNKQIFTQSLKSNRKIILTYHNGAGKLHVSELVIPLYFCPRESKPDTDIYYLWNLQVKCNRMLILKSSQIISMELSDEGFAKTD